MNNVDKIATVGTVWESAADTWTSHAVMLLPTLAVSGVIEYIELDKGLDKAGVGEKIRLVMKQTNKNYNVSILMTPIKIYTHIAIYYYSTSTGLFH